MSTKPVLVGVDGSPRGLRALRWAADEALLRRRPLELVHAYAPRFFAVPDGSPHVPPEVARTGALALLELAASEVIGRDLDIRTRAEPGFPAQVLLDRAHEAAMIVVGSHGRNDLVSLLLGSTSLQVAMHASVPVAVVRVPQDGERGPSAGRVVVAVDDFDHADLALGFAFDAAHVREASVIAVNTWSPPDTFGEVIPGDAWDDVEAEHAERLADRLAGWRSKFPDVPVTQRVVCGDPVRTVVEESVGAALTVVGGRGHGGLAGLLLGSVSHGILHLAESPVVVVRHPGSGRDRGRV